MQYKEISRTECLVSKPHANPLFRDYKEGTIESKLVWFVFGQYVFIHKIETCHSYICELSGVEQRVYICSNTDMLERKVLGQPKRFSRKMLDRLAREYS